MKVTLEISGMNCGHCVKAVTEALQAWPGAESLAVEVGRASFVSASAPDEDALRAAIDDAGFELVAVHASA